MAQDADKNLENFTLVRGELWGKRNPLSATERCKRKVQERIVAGLRRAPRGERIKSRALENVAAGVTNPSGELVKLIYRLKMARQSFADVRAATVEPIDREVHTAFGIKYDDDQAA